jgi:phosphatidate cytidylyltransferase
VNKMGDLAAHSDHAPGIRGIKLNWDWVTRPLFGLALAAITVATVFSGADYMAFFAAAVCVAGAREWHRMITNQTFGHDFYVTSGAIVVSLVAALAWPHSILPWAVLGAGALVALVRAKIRLEPALWQSAGTIYLGGPMLALLQLRSAPHGAMIIVGLFAAVWATDTGALVCGNLIGGPRLWPSLSPNKTWAGTLGGVAAAAAAESAFVAFLGGHPFFGAVLGASIATVAHCGDLFESWVKRVFQRKDSGSLIPGHGGVLDRIDSTLAAAPCMAALVILAGFNPLFGALS